MDATAKPLHKFDISGCNSVGFVRWEVAGSNFAGLHRFPGVVRQVWLVGCLLAGLIGFVPVLSAQPDTFGGDPDSSAFILVPQDTDDWTRHFYIGALVGMNISAKFQQSGTFGISGNNPAQGIYDDGYVRTDNAGDPLGHTYYWGTIIRRN